MSTILQLFSNISDLSRRIYLYSIMLQDYSLRYWLKKGAPSTKLVMGVPFFGRSFTLANASNTLPGALIKGPGKEGKYTLVGFYTIN